eukprot:scaffold181263_cov20-Tisochrysis_lutea.AAC.1
MQPLHWRGQSFVGRSQLSNRCCQTLVPGTEHEAFFECLLCPQSAGPKCTLIHLHAPPAWSSPPRTAGSPWAPRGQVILGTVNEVTMVPFVSGQLQNLGLALAIAKRGNLPGAEALVGQQFEQLFASGAFKEAAEVAADSPKVRAGKAYMYVHSLRGKGKGVGGVGGCKHFWPC